MIDKQEKSENGYFHYITAGNGLCAMVVKQGTTVTPYFTYTDHLGSILTVTDISGAVAAQQNFDAWGRNRNPTNWSYTSVPTVPDWLYRGFTGHEHLVQFALVNMNGRMYDPANGRMLSPDNYVQFPMFTQSFNRYSYVANNPLTFTDPTGNLFGTFFTAVWDFASTVFTKGAIDPWNTRENRRDAWRNFDPTAPWSKTNKAWRIDKGLFQTDGNRTFFGQVLELVSRFTWEVPQTALGNVYSHIRNVTGSVDNVEYYGGATLVNNDKPSTRFRWGATLSNYINSQNVEADIVNDDIFRHEYGHTLQSRLVGPLYITSVAIPSLIGSELNDLGIHAHNQEWYEVQANRMAFRYFNNHEPAALNPTLGGRVWNDELNPRRYVYDWYFAVTHPPLIFSWWLLF